MNHTEIHAAYSILERGIRAKVRAPLFLRLIGIKFLPLLIRRLYAGTLLKIVPHYLKTGITQEQLKEITLEEGLSLMDKHGKAISRCVAIAVVNRRYDLGLSRLLAWYMLGYMDWREILKLLETVLIYGGIGDFMSTTRLIRGLKITDPAQKLGQKKKGS